jgi:putative tricarboxylic transport membrane protein
MGPLDGLIYGFGVSFSGPNLLACFIGVFLGTVIGVLPGIGPVGALSILLPSTFLLDPTASLIMLAGIWYGSMYGGSTTSILVNVPGEVTSIVTAIDGYQMAKKGRAGAALAVSAVGSFVAGTIGLVALTTFAPPLAQVGLMFAAPEFFALILLGLIFLSQLGGRSVLQSFLMAAFGLVLGTIGIERLSGLQRFTFGSLTLSQGLDIIPVAMGLYGVSEVLLSAEQITTPREIMKFKFRQLFPTIAEWKKAILPMLRGGGLGFFIGLLPGPGSLISTFASYTLEKRISKHPEEFGKGAIEGVAGPESANNSACAGAMVPLFALGIPFNPAIALLLGALFIHGVQPGPFFMTQHPEIFWGVIASMYLGNLMLLVLNLPLVGVFASILRLPQYILMAFILLFCIVGAYGVNNSVFGIYVLLIMGVLGYILKKFGFDVAPLVLAIVLGPILEDSFVQSLIMYRGSFWLIFTRPLTSGIFAIGILAIFLPVILRIFKRKTGKKSNPLF